MVKLTVTDPNAQTVQGVVSVTINAPPVGTPPVFTDGPNAAPNPVAAGQNVAFSATAVGSSALTYDWDFGDGSAKASGAAQTHSYAKPGTFNVTVTATDASALTASASVLVMVNALPGGTFAVSNSLLKSDFKKAGNDSLMLAGSLGLPGSFVTTGKSASLNFGPFSVSAPINGKHESPAYGSKREESAGWRSAAFADVDSQNRIEKTDVFCSAIDAGIHENGCERSERFGASVAGCGWVELRRDDRDSIWR